MAWAGLERRARALDAADPLGAFRARFRLPGGCIYLDGNSLGPLPEATAARMRRVVDEEWGAGLIAGWNPLPGGGGGWIDLPLRIGRLLEPLLGAQGDSVIACDSVSVNLFKLAAAALAANLGRRVILSETGNFPTDLYILEGVAEALGAELVAVPRAEVAARLGPDIAVLALTHAHYRHAGLWDMAAVTAAAHRAGALTLWDLSHSAGAVALDLAGAGADFAVGCGYKYLNGGPGAPAFAYVAPRHQAGLSQPVRGWMGHAAPFAFEDGYRPGAGMLRLLAGTPPVLSMAALEEGVRLAAEAGQARLAAKARALRDLFLDCVAAIGDPELAPELPEGAQGGHVLLRHPEAFALVQALIAEGVVGDYREPGGARFGFSPLPLGFDEVVEAARRLARVVGERRWDRPEYRVRRAVT